jgi:hypothetical protein
MRAIALTRHNPLTLVGEKKRKTVENESEHEDDQGSQRSAGGGKHPVLRVGDAEEAKRGRFAYFEE